MDMTGRGAGRGRRKRRAGRNAQILKEGEGGLKHTGQFIERQTVTLGPIATERRAEAFESKMKMTRGRKSERKRVKVIRNLGGSESGGKKRRRSRINKSDSHRFFLFSQGRQFSADLKGEPWLSRCVGE